MAVGGLTFQRFYANCQNYEDLTTETGEQEKAG